MIEVSNYQKEMEKQDKVFDGKRYVKRITLYKRSVKLKRKEVKKESITGFVF
tara:strand:+ start:369 stop:524 length:156 start_codon:yes stop_codon:yes gene_type:complete